MYQEQRLIKVFERLRARDHIVEPARKVDDACSNDLDLFVEPARKVDDACSNDLDLFSAHADAECRDGLVSAVLSIIVVVAVLIGVVALFWKQLQVAI
jgi:hypothetical protein